MWGITEKIQKKFDQIDARLNYLERPSYNHETPYEVRERLRKLTEKIDALYSYMEVSFKEADVVPPRAEPIPFNKEEK